MGLQPGAKLGQYEILGLLGAGGIDEVHRARDSRLGREVAIEVLPGDVARDTERLARFRREATPLAALNHPHIASIHGLEESGGSPFLAVEPVEGEDLAERLKRGSDSGRGGVGIAPQIAEAQEEAREKGIVHRDLKPGNVKLTPDGKVEVLDFGLATVSSAEAAPEPGRGSSDAPRRRPSLRSNHPQPLHLRGVTLHAQLSHVQAEGAR